ncbi:flagellar hook-length control protein FliK [Neorhizobium galegae]|uniref:flagellar hook-length control protein FliK n=1 Tax=Neorhizobium galegae TaxID=399 RepID=UPI000620EA4D|nr:flagellar hook-length control protein FliK [Neorhizobium galegae]MCQ1764112.1 flagellar hook-length control protein FliK [Neorhizobium galegae]MCQ1846183.1 flagellar hook-length control protein FliK [Neorhizobium galegae]CDZ35611.1 Flagellar hook-length control protein [Neorhizobium galegae bv. officinalis]
MITDILGGGKTGAADAASSTKQGVAGRKGADGSSGGFSDALSGFDREASSSAGDVPDEDARASSAEERMAGDVKQGKPKPIIDIKPQSLRRPAEEAEDSAALKQAPVNDAKEKQMTPAERKLREALEAAKAVARKSDEVQGKRPGKSEKDAQAETEGGEDLDVSMLVADDAKITDMLSLLTSGEAAGAINAMASKNATGQQNKRTKGQDDDGREVDALGLKDAKHAGAGGAEGDPLSTPVDADRGAPGTRVFRFSNARNDQHVDMAVGGRGERSTAEFRSSSGGAAENITVLDARRFLGLAPNSNGANLTAMLSGDADWAGAMSPSSALSNAAAQSSTGTVVNTLKLQLNPHDLGAVTATLRLHGEELNVHLTVETRAAYRQLSEDSGGILDALRAQGFAVDQVTISIAPTADSDGTSSQQGQPGQTGQQAMAEGGRQGQAARGQQQNGERQAADQGTRNANDAASDNVAGTAPGGARPGQLYL